MTRPLRTFVLLSCLATTLQAAQAPADSESSRSPATTWSVCFSPRGNCTEVIVTVLGKAQRQVLIQAYSFTSAPIAQALVDAHKRGVKVEVLLDKSNRREKYSSADFLAHAGIPTSIDAAHSIAHNKVIVIDGETVVSGSFNFSKAAEENNAENLLVLKDKALSDRYAENWRLHAAHSEPYYGRAVAESASGQGKSPRDDGAQRAIGLVKSYRNPSDAKSQPTRLGKFLEGVNQAFRAKGFPTELEWSARRESGTVFHVEAAQSHPELVENNPGGITIYSFHADLQSGNVVAAPDVRPTPQEQMQSKPVVYTDTRYYLEHLGLED